MRGVRVIVQAILFSAATVAAAAPVLGQASLEQVVAGLEWREIGPAVMGGRIADLAVVESNPAIFYVGTATGGLWKTTNHGTSWEPVFDDQPTSSIGAVTLAPSNPNVVWVGTGEPQNRQSSPWGAGLFKSLDAGRTWRLMGLADTRHIGRIVVHPGNPDIVYVAAVGHLWGPNEERGVFKTTDGGETWRKVLYVDANTGAIDLAMDPGDPEALFAAMYQRRRTNFGFNGGGPGSGIYRTVTGGASWSRLEDGLPSGPMGRIGLDVYRGDGNLVYARIEAAPPKRGIYRSTDRGESWEQLSDWNPRPMYFGRIWIDPTNPEKIFLGGVDLSISFDGGRNWDRRAASAVHSDHHAMWIDPNNSNHVIMGSDGGVSVSFDAGRSWRMYDNLPIGQFYEIGLDMRDPYYVCGGLQDNGSWCGPSRTLSRHGVRNSDWFNVWGGDGFYVRIDPNDPTVVFAESQNGNVGRVDLRTMERLFIRPDPPESEDDEGNGYRWNWNTPIVMSAHDPATVYVGANKLIKTTDRGLTWREISPDLSKATDRSTLEIMGRKLSDEILSRNDGIGSFGNVTTISESPIDPNVLYVGTDDGNVRMTRDGGARWTDLTPRFPDVPSGTYVSRVLASAHDAGTVYVTFDGHTNDDYRAYVFVSTNAGGRFRRITEGLPEWSVNVVAEHPRSRNLLFVGNEVGVYLSIDAGQRWTRLDNNLPTVPVDDIKVHPRENDLVLGTHGRSIWILDDITPLEQLSRDVLAKAAHLFPTRAAMLYNEYSPQGWNPGAYAAPNPPYGARIRYYVGTGSREPTVAENGSNGNNGSDGGDSVTVTIADASGETIRELRGPARAGIHEVVWDLRHAPPYVSEDGGARGFFGRARGPRVLPGEYRVSLRANGASASGSVAVHGDDRIEVARADLETRQAALMRLYALATPVYEAGESVQRLAGQIDQARELLRGREGVDSTLRQEARELDRVIGEVRRDIGGARGRGARLFSALEGWTARPTSAQERQAEEVWNDATAAIERLNGLITDRVPAFYGRLNAEGIRPDPGQPVAVPARP
jgi:photosystem II stability/assembly factor-like uncharacterized protein